MNSTSHIPLVSIIIPCYNQGRFLQQAIDSALQQSHANIEVLVVDDGATDNTKAVAQQNPKVTYIYQSNTGLSAARNTGIKHSKGTYLAFLDADDMLYPNAIEVNLSYLLQNEDLAFVSGSHDKVYKATGVVQPVVKTVPSDHYKHLLRGNYIAMHATVLYRRWVFDEQLFDATLHACEDYDLYLRLARLHPVRHHARRIAAYNIHSENMSGNDALMLTSAVRVLKRQKPLLQNKAEAAAYQQGLANWKAFYLDELIEKLQNRKLSKGGRRQLLLNRPHLMMRHFYNCAVEKLGYHFPKLLPPYRLSRLKLDIGEVKTHTPPPGKVKLGDFQRLTPFSTQFGYDRGGPVDRYYIEAFLSQQAPSIRGSVLEIGDNSYTTWFGGDQVTQSDILHVDGSNPEATIVGDISNAPHIPDNSFDCIILTQTLHLIYDFKEALHTCYRILKPNGALLLTVPGITPIDHGEWGKTWFWSFTDKAMQRLLNETFPGCEASIYPFGNVFTATAFLYGMGLPEVPHKLLAKDDPHYQVIVTVKATKKLRDAN